MHSRLANYEDVLRGRAGFIAASEHPDPQNWHSYVDRLGLLARYPGTTAVEFIRWVPEAQLESFVAERRRQGSPDFQSPAHAWRAGIPGSERRALYNDLRRTSPVRPHDSRNRPGHGTAAERRSGAGARYRHGAA